MCARAAEVEPAPEENLGIKQPLCVPPNNLLYAAAPRLLFIQGTPLFANASFTEDCSVHTPCRGGEEVEEPFECAFRVLVPS